MALQNPPSQFGKLTVLDSTIKQNVRRATCQCECGRVVEKFWSNLIGGRTTSCGRAGCRSKVEYPKEKLALRGSVACDTETLRKAWDRYHHDDPAQRRTIAQLSKIHNVNVHTLYSRFRLIKRCGGFPDYLKALARGSK